MFKKLITAILAIAMVTPNIVLAKDYKQKFWDVDKSHWAFEAIAELTDRGVINGYNDGSFKPEETISRAEWAKIMVGAAGISTDDDEVYFRDMDGHWAVPYVNAASDYLTAYSDNTYRPDQAVVREDVTMALVRLKGYSIDDVDYSYLSTFTDMNSISNNMKAYIAVAVEKGLINGFEDNTFRGQSTLTRAEAAKLLWKAFQYGNDNKVANTPSATVTEKPVTATPTTKPTAKPVDKSTPKPTKKPTPEPTEESTPEPTEEPTESPKLYVIDTLVSKPGVRNLYNYTTDNRGNLYYATDDAVYKLDITNGTKEEFQLNSGLDIIGDDVDLTNFKTKAICWDISTNRLLMQGSYDNINAADPDNVNNKFIISTPGMDGELELITSNFDVENGVTSVDSGWARIVCTTSDGSIVSNKYMFNGDNLDGIRIVPESDHWVTDYIITPNAMQIGNGIYYIGVDDDDYTFEAYEYDYKEVKELFEFTAYAFGVCKDGLYTITEEGLKLQNWKGKTIKQISLSDIEVADSKPFQPNKVAAKLIVTNNAVIFYDNNSSSFRMLKPNE